MSVAAVGSFSPATPPTLRGRPRFTMAVRSKSVSVSPILTKFQKDCDTPLPVLRHVADAMADDMRAGLSVDGGGDLKMILSYVDALPSGYVSKFKASLKLRRFVLSASYVTDCEFVKGTRKGCFMQWISVAPIFEC